MSLYIKYFGAERREFQSLFNLIFVCLFFLLWLCPVTRRRRRGHRGHRPGDDGGDRKAADVNVRGVWCTDP